ncbi:hypothetical protein [Xylocopilactobacillus apis]|uniref:Uncharacterized protein n=1 Tax=Xylocopilactobacillus apis TaxID=2932183 RepID=A0AAU9DRB2_9LACO|nr:hypothetical protein [Xylocopilactobacillus apis]BDR56178.1 hypothetical protein KIMC2_07400 [Xylocopilactobacillus apis]
MGIDLYSKGNKNLSEDLSQKYQKLLGVETVEIVPQSEIMAFNILIDSLMKQNERLLIITSEFKNLACKFRWVLDHYQVEYIHQEFNDLDLKKVESIIESYCPQVIVYDFLSFSSSPDWEQLRHLSRINGSELVVCLGEAITSDLAQETSLSEHADFMTAQWGDGLIISKNSDSSLIDEAILNFFQFKPMLASEEVDVLKSNENMDSLCLELNKTFSCEPIGSFSHLIFKEKEDRIEDFQKILRQIGIEVKEENIDIDGKKSFGLSTYQVTHQGYTSKDVKNFGKLICNAFNEQKNIIRLEELNQQVLKSIRID